MKGNRPLQLFSLLFGVFLMGSNAVTIIMPMRLADQGLSYDKIGAAMSMMAFGMLIIKPVIGRHSDLAGVKKYILLSLFLGGIVLFLMAFHISTGFYVLLNCLFGLCRGMFTSVSSAYTAAISEKETLGSSFGSLVGISTLFTCFGGILAGVLYPFSSGAMAMILIASAYLLFGLAGWKYLPDVNGRESLDSRTALDAGQAAVSKKNERKKSEKSERLLSWELFRTISPHTYVFCLIVFLHQFTTGPLWNTFVPLHFYTVFAVSSTFVGILMSMDELIGSPVSIVAGKLSDRLSDQKFLSGSYVLAALVSISLLFADTPQSFMVCFLLCGCFVTCTQIVLPKSASGFMKSSGRGFEFALISSCGGLGEWLGNLTLGEIIRSSSINGAVLVFCGLYLVAAALSYWNLRPGATTV